MKTVANPPGCLPYDCVQLITNAPTAGGPQHFRRRYQTGGNAARAYQTGSFHVVQKTWTTHTGRGGRCAF
eukprot:11190236-Lingulodinium_polyedra.AAC.1